MSELNERRHGPDLHIRDKDLLTGHDARRLITEEFARRDANERVTRSNAIQRFNALPWWKRLARRLVAVPAEIA